MSPNADSQQISAPIGKTCARRKDAVAVALRESAVERPDVRKPPQKLFTGKMLGERYELPLVVDAADARRREEVERVEVLFLRDANAAGDDRCICLRSQVGKSLKQVANSGSNPPPLNAITVSGHTIKRGCRAIAVRVIAV